MAAVLIAAGYAALVWKFGWIGLAAGAMHIMIMLAAARR